MSQTWSKIKKKIGEGFALPYIIGDRGGFVITTHCNGRLMIKQPILPFFEGRCKSIERMYSRA